MDRFRDASVKSPRVGGTGAVQTLVLRIYGMQYGVQTLVLRILLLRMQILLLPMGFGMQTLRSYIP
jgi:hypothetical protein